MKRRTRIFLFAGAAVALVAAGAAVSGAHERGYGKMGKFGPRGPAMQMFQYLDANDDGKLGRDEAQGVVDSKLTQFDGDGDKSLSIKEFEGLWLDVSRRRMVDAFQRLDDDGDGKVTQAEMNRPLNRLFRRADRNEDGVIDRNDRRWRHGRRGD